MPNSSQEFSKQEATTDQGEQIQRFLYRILPFWPLIILLVVISLIGARIYLRYQIPIYVSKARLVVNDDTQQKTANLQEIMRLDTRNLPSETEREMQVLGSRDLMKSLVSRLQLNVQYTQRGRVKTSQYYAANLPFKLQLQDPESIKFSFVADAELVGNKIKFDGNLYPFDSIMTSRIGNIRWIENTNENVDPDIKKVEVTVSTISTTASKLKSSLSVVPISKQSQILDLVYYDPIAARGVMVLDTLISLYGISTVDYKGRIYQNAQRFLDGRLSLVSDELNGVEKNLQAYQTSEGIIDLGKEGEIYLTQSKENLKRIGEIQVQQDVLIEIEKYVIQRNNSNSAIPATLGISDPVLVDLLNKLYQSEAELEKTRQLSGEKNPQIPVLEDMIRKLKPSILKSIENLKVNLSASKSQLQAEYNQMVGSLNKIPAKERKMLDITRQQGIKNAIYTFLLQKKEESAIAGASIVPNYRIIERAESGGIVSPEPKKIYTIAILIAIFIAIIYIYFREFAGKQILFRAQIERALPMIPVVSELVYQPHTDASPIVVGDGKRTLVAEQFRELRTSINYIGAGSKEKCKVILTTSSIPKEGKSFVTINAAISISLTGDRIVLLEFDLRKPKISDPLKISRDPGLSNFLIGKASAEEIIKPHATINNLFIIPSGPIPPNPAELLSSPRLNELINYLRQNFDYVLIDSPPVAAVTDAKILANVADATIFIVRHNYTSHVFLNLINDIYQKNGLPNINIVFNGIVNKRILGYGYGRGYGYGYGYGYSYGYGYTSESKQSGSIIVRAFKSLFEIIFGKGKPKTG